MRLNIFHLHYKDLLFRLSVQESKSVTPSPLGEGRDGGKKYIGNRLIILIVLILNSSLTISAQSDRKYIRQGNGKYSDGKYPEAEILYRKALNDNKTSADAGFNVGDAMYKQNKFDEAAKQFLGTAGAMTDVSKKSDSYHNLGNSLLKADKYEEAIAAYKNSLRLVPGRNETKFNLAYAQDKLKEQQEQKDQDKKKEPSEFARKLKAEADKLAAGGRFAEAFNLMQEGLKKDETVSYYNDFIQKTGKVAKIDLQIK